MSSRPSAPYVLVLYDLLKEYKKHEWKYQAKRMYVFRRDRYWHSICMYLFCMKYYQYMHIILLPERIVERGHIIFIVCTVMSRYYRQFSRFKCQVPSRNQSLRDLDLIFSIWHYIENVKIGWFFTQNSQNCLFFDLKLTDSNNNIYIENVILLLNINWFVVPRLCKVPTQISGKTL